MDNDRLFPPLSGEAFPILSLRLEGMRSMMRQELSGQQEELSKLVQRELDKVCSLENLHEQVHSLVASQIRGRIAAEVEHYFQRGEGAAAIREAVTAGLKKIMNGLPET